MIVSSLLLFNEKIKLFKRGLYLGYTFIVLCFQIQ